MTPSMRIGIGQLSCCPTAIKLLESLRVSRLDGWVIDSIKRNTTLRKERHFAGSRSVMLVASVHKCLSVHWRMGFPCIVRLFYAGISMKVTILVVCLFLLSGCGAGAAESIFRIIPNSNNVCPHGNDVFTNQCHG